MKNNQQKKQAAAFQECKLKAAEEIKTCYHPNCDENSINSHILQKNGILSSLESDKHLMEMEINPFLDEIHIFKRIGINKAYSFKCFCNTHDTDLFKKIETEEIDFLDYQHLILFTLRTIYNEKFRKQVNVRMRELIIDKYPNLFNIDLLNNQNEGEKLGLLDIEKTENLIWKDISEKTESFVFETRVINRIELCLTGFYNYETTRELEDYRLKYGKDKEDVIDIFINVFPYKDKTTIIMGYKKTHESDVKGHVNTLIKESEKRFLRQLTNLLMFRCETWVISEEFYKKRIKKCELFFGMAAHYSNQNYNERKFFLINVFEENFCEQMKQWEKVE